VRNDREHGDRDDQEQWRRQTVAKPRNWLVLNRNWLLFSVLFLPIITLQCVSRESGTTQLARASSLFHKGYLEKSQELAAEGLARFAGSSPKLAGQFLLIEAESLGWRGMNDDELRLFAANSDKFNDSESSVQALSLQGVALAHLHNFPAAEARLKQAQALCTANPNDSCGEVPRGFGILEFERGALDLAQSYFQQSLQFAKSHHDRWLETTLLLYLGAVAVESDHFDAAVDWSKAAYQVAGELGSEDLSQNALGNLGFAYSELGDKERALDLFNQAQKQARQLGDSSDEIKWLTNAGNVHMDSGELSLARTAYQQALTQAEQIADKEEINDILIDLGLVAISAGSADEADNYAKRALAMAQQSGSWPDQLDAMAVELQAAALRGDLGRSKELLQTVEKDPDSQVSMKWACENAMARLYEIERKPALAEVGYQSALSTFEAALAKLKHEESQLIFVANGTRIYDDYIHFLVTRGRTEDALRVADQSRARTLSHGLERSAHERPSTWKAATNSIPPQMVARKAGATLLFYWLGEKQSYLWAVTPKNTTLFPLPDQGKIASLVTRYNKELLGVRDPLEAQDRTGKELFQMLVAPALESIDGKSPVMILADGPLSLMNFETLIVPADKPDDKPHYWIEDVTLSSAPSLAMLATAKSDGPAINLRKAPAMQSGAGGKLLLLGDAVSPAQDYPELPFASLEMKEIQQHFVASDAVVFARNQATSEAYLRSDPKQYSYIHFVSHGVASRTDPLDSAIILSRSDSGDGSPGHGSFKLYAREIMQHPIDARVVTISACYSSGARAFAGEGMVGLSWAFLRAGAHSTIGALWEVNDNSTSRLMGSFYEGLEAGLAPASALRNAKLNLLHSKGGFRKPFYWAAFQLYTRM
jgi:CHAT domain-containing protein/tetratricopeptide (TPR) repeat protein